jgi:hypothetical protein
LQTISAQQSAQFSGKQRTCLATTTVFQSTSASSDSKLSCLKLNISNGTGRNKPNIISQVGIRCRHCRLLPPKSRHRGTTYYPARLNGLYQAAQSMARGHLCNHCGHIPHSIRQDLLVLRERKSSAGGGKKYWGDVVQRNEGETNR